jgi:hypothetical protein
MTRMTHSKIKTIEDAEAYLEKLKVRVEQAEIASAQARNELRSAHAVEQAAFGQYCALVAQHYRESAQLDEVRRAS